MKTQTIKQIEVQVEQLQQGLQDFVPARHPEGHYGSEQEYTAQSLKQAIQAILTEIRGLIKAHNRFVQLSTSNERDSICRCLELIHSYLSSQNYNHVAQQFEILKTIIRNYGARGSSETQSELEERINSLNAQSVTVEENIRVTNQIREESEQASGKIQSAGEQIESLGNMLSDLQEKSSQIEGLRNQSEQSNQAIEQFLASAKSHDEDINSFVQKIAKREEQLTNQEQATTSYKEQLTSFEEQQKEKIKKADELINQARNALGYTTATGISAAFDERYRDEKGKGKKSLWWLVTAIAFVLGGIVAGVWLLLDDKGIQIGIAISRITIMSISFSGAWFCANQYVKYKNILEDYGYKTVLAKSMMAFLDQLTGEERERYLEMVLFEIHKDPLRKRHDADDRPEQRIIDTLKRKIKENAKESREQASNPINPSD